MINQLVSRGFDKRDIILLFTSFSMSNIEEKSNRVINNQYLVIKKHYHSFDVDIKTNNMICIESCSSYQGKNLVSFYQKKVVLNSLNDFFKNKVITFDKKKLHQNITTGEYEKIKEYYNKKLELIEK